MNDETTKEFDDMKARKDLLRRKGFQPLTTSMGNLLAYRLGKVGLNLMDYPREKIGDEIDRGLVLRRLLEESGFIVIDAKGGFNSVPQPYGEEFRCCEKATRLPCVCAVAFRCPDHPQTHIGSHE